MTKHRPSLARHCDLLEAVTIAGPLADLTVSVVWVFQIADLRRSLASDCIMGSVNDDIMTLLI